MAQLDEYLWMAIVSTVFAFIYAFGIGANDVANAFGTSVASKSITLGQAVVIAGIFEFCGAFFLGASVTGTIRGGIFKEEYYTDQPETVMLGFMTSMVTATFMLLAATYFAMPVSTTHTVVGAIMGFSIAAEGFSSINWNECIKIISSWLISPIGTGIVAFIVFSVIKHAILLAPNPFNRAYYSFSIVLTLAIGINIFYVLDKGTKGFTDFRKNVYKLAWAIPASLAVGAVCGLLWIWPFGPMAKRNLVERKAKRERLEAAYEEYQAQEAEAEEKVTEMINNPGNKWFNASVIDPDADIIEEPMAVDDDVVKEPKKVAVSTHSGTAMSFHEFQKASEPKKEAPTSTWGKIRAATIDQDLEAQSFHENKRSQDVWDTMVKYDPDVEQLFTFVQVFSASMNSFAHGANDIANAIGPVVGIIDIYRTGELSSKSPVPKWILAYGGIALVLGFALYGYKVIKTLGYKLTAMSPTRGSSAELSASLMVLTASYIGIPVSTTQCVVGAVAGVGCVEGWRTVQWGNLAKVCVSWVVVFFTAAILSAGMFSFTFYSPSAPGMSVPE